MMNVLGMIDTAQTQLRISLTFITEDFAFFLMYANFLIHSNAPVEMKIEKGQKHWRAIRQEKEYEREE